MRPAWQSTPPPRQPPPHSLSSSHFPPPSSSLLPVNQHHQHHQQSHGAHAPASSSSNPLFPTSEDSRLHAPSTALDRVMGFLDGFEDDMDCPLCLEEMDISDLNFKPCPCGYQICRFCYNHIKEDLNNRCPACRAPYDDTTVEFKAIKPDELKRLQAAKKLRDKRRKDEALTVKNMANVRVRQRAQVHIQGMTTKIANEDTLNQLKSSDQFGQYGKVVKLFMSKRSSTVTQPPSTHPLYQPVNVYVNYRTPTEASACIAAIDGSTTEDGHKLKAIWGTTRYCPTYLKGARCGNENCMQAHEPGEEIEGLTGPATRDEIYTYQAISDTDVARNKAAAASTAAKKPEATLPATASWASKNAPPLPTPHILPFNASLPPLSASIKPPVVHPVRQPTIPVSKPQNHPLPARPSSRATKAKEKEEKLERERKERREQEEREREREEKEKERQQEESPVEEVSATVVAEETAAPIASSSSSTPPSPTRDAQPFLTNGTSETLTNGIYTPPPPPQPQFPELEFGEGAFSFSLNLDVKGKGRAQPLVNGATSTLTTEVEDDSEEPQRPEFITANLLDGFRSQSTAEMQGVTAAALYPPTFPPPNLHPTASSYLGSFDPFADTSALGGGGGFGFGAIGGGGGLPSPFADDPHSNTPSPPPMGEDMSRRSSRFGFARRASSSVGQQQAPSQGQQVNGGAGGISSGQQAKNEFAQAMSRLGFGVAGLNGGGRESPAPPPGIGLGGQSGGGVSTFAPPGIGMPHPHQRPPSTSSIGYSALPPLASPSASADLTRTSSSSADPTTLWPGVNLSAPSPSPHSQQPLNSYPSNVTGTFPPGVLRSLASPSASTTSSPQLSPRTMARVPYSGGPPPGVGGAASSALPPGISLSRAPIPAASFPLPPPAPRSSGQQSTIVGKEDLLALIAKAQAAAPKQVQQQEPHPFFSDPAILNARLASVSGSNGAAPSPNISQQQQQQQQQQMPQQQQPYYAQQHQQYSLDPQQQYRPPFDQQQQQFAAAGYSLPPPPGVRPPSAHFQQQQQQQLYRNGGKA